MPLSGISPKNQLFVFVISNFYGKFQQLFNHCDLRHQEETLILNVFTPNKHYNDIQRDLFKEIIEHCRAINLAINMELSKFQRAKPSLSNFF